MSCNLWRIALPSEKVVMMCFWFFLLKQSTLYTTTGRASRGRIKKEMLRYVNNLLSDTDPDYFLT
jgi:hypothetical protein